MPETKKYLNRDGLEEYNSLLPHSSTEIQEYVDDWLDTHPEATTTVPDDGITTRKLADGSVTRNKLAADVAHLLGGMMVTGEVQGEILSADDAYSVAPLSMSIDGKSTQDGRPTPDVPVPIDSIEVLELPIIFAGKNLCPTANGSDIASTWIRDGQNYYLRTGVYGNGAKLTLSCRMDGAPSTTGAMNRLYLTVAGTTGLFCDLNTAGTKSATVTIDGEAILILNANGATNVASLLKNIQLELGPTATPYEPYNAITANIPMQGHVLRNLPDGTHDTMTLSYLRESDKAGWAWYSRELIQRVQNRLVSSLDWSTLSGYEHHFYTSPDDSALGPGLNIISLACSALRGIGARSLGGIRNISPDAMQVCYRSSYPQIFALAGSNISDVASFLALIGNAELQYPLATPITTQLNPVELPVLPAPNCTVWSDPTTGLKMSYMRDANIVVSNIEQAIADL